jgi:hypothetical protein
MLACLKNENLNENFREFCRIKKFIYKNRKQRKEI